MPELDRTWSSVRLHTLGHGTLDADAFVSLARRSGIEEIVDVRRFPGSRRQPHFGREAMVTWLGAADVAYRWMPALGGRRAASATSPNVGLRNPQFRAYADHMSTREFTDGVAELVALAASTRVAVLCSESVWWRCHRRLLADHLVLLQGADVQHLMHDDRLVSHPVAGGAEVAGDVVVYRAA